MQFGGLGGAAFRDDFVILVQKGIDTTSYLILHHKYADGAS